MPIRPENRARYPKNWSEISQARREAAGWRCEGSPDYPECRAVAYEPHPETGSKVFFFFAHLDHMPENCAPENLRAWCQRCHLHYDRDHHSATRAQTKRNKEAQRGQQFMF